MVLNDERGRKLMNKKKVASSKRLSFAEDLIENLPIGMMFLDKNTPEPFTPFDKLLESGSYHKSKNKFSTSDNLVSKLVTFFQRE